MVPIDLQDAYFHVNIVQSHHKFLHFTVGDDHHQFKALLLGIAFTPRIFTKTMVVVVAYLCTLGISLFP